MCLFVVCVRRVLFAYIYIIYLFGSYKSYMYVRQTIFHDIITAVCLLLFQSNKLTFINIIRKNCTLESDLYIIVLTPHL